MKNVICTPKIKCSLTIQYQIRLGVISMRVNHSEILITSLHLPGAAREANSFAHPQKQSGAAFPVWHPAEPGSVCLSAETVSSPAAAQAAQVQQHAGGAQWRAASRLLPLHTDSVCLLSVWKCLSVWAVFALVVVGLSFLSRSWCVLTGSRTASAQTCSGRGPISATR